MENLIIGFFAGIIICGAVWQFFLRNKKDEDKTDDTELKVELARSQAEVKAGEDAKQELTNQLDDKKEEVKELYKKVDKIVEGVDDYKKISEQAINKHDVFGTRIKNWFEKLTTNVTYQGKFNQQIL